MSLIGRVVKSIRPDETKKVKDDRMIGFGSANLILGNRLNKLSLSIDQMERSEMLKLLREMSYDGAIADKALEKLCQDATANPVRIDAPARRKSIIEDLLKRINYEELRETFLYLLLRDGDEFLQLQYSKSGKAGKVGYVTAIMRMPTETMIRNTNERDEFSSPINAFAQVDDIRNGIIGSYNPPIWFPWAKIVHARNNKDKSKFFRYGWSFWASAIKIFNMCLVQLEASAIMRHINSQSLRVHLVGKGTEGKTDEDVINQYQNRVEKNLDESTTDLFIDGNNEIEVIGGTKNVMSGVDDIMMTLSILSIALDYPLDLLSGLVSRSSGGEELFRKEVILKRAVSAIIGKESREILRPIIDRELLLSGGYGEYRITTFPASFEDENKRSKRGLGEVSAFTKSLSTFHDENNSEIGWQEEQERIKDDAEWVQGLFNKYPEAMTFIAGSIGRKNPASGTQGSDKEVTDQQERKTLGDRGTDDREDNRG